MPRGMTILGSVLLILSIPSTLAECPSVESPTAEVSGVYVELDQCQPTCLISLWIYQESNGIPGLQRADAIRDDTCGGILQPDVLLITGFARGINL